MKFCCSPPAQFLGPFDVSFYFYVILRIFLLSFLLPLRPISIFALKVVGAFERNRCLWPVIETIMPYSFPLFKENGIVGDINILKGDSRLLPEVRVLLRIPCT